MFRIFILFLLLILTGIYVFGQKPDRETIWVDSVLTHMTLNEKIGQLFMIAAYSNKNSDYDDELEKTIKKYHIGGLVFFQGEPVKQVTLTNRYQKASKYPLLIGMDAEHGLGWRLQSAMEFPKMLTIGATSDDSLAYKLGATIAKHCRELGVHINFAPVVDINNNPRNPVIGTRSFGERRENTTRKAIMYMKGSLSMKVLPVAKHFPGHGDTDTDSHHALPSINRTSGQLDSIELYPYRKMIEARIPAIMISHLNVPALDSTGTPASLSPAIINWYLRQNLRYAGLCFTDALNMKGVAQDLSSGGVELKALLAGNDILVMPGNIDKAIAKIKQAIADGILSEKTIDEKCWKILQAKYNYVLPNTLPLSTSGLWSRINTPADFCLKQTLYKEAITLIKNQNSLIPLKSLDTLNIACLNFGGKTVNSFQTMLARYAPIYQLTCDRQLTDNQTTDLAKKLSDYNCVIIYNGCASDSPAHNFGYSDDLARLIQQLGGKRLILCQPATPYGLAKYTGLEIDALLVSYDEHLYAQQYAAQAIFGGIALKGKLPVGVDPDFSAGTGIRTSKTRLGYAMPEMCGITSFALAEIDTICKMAIRKHATPGCQVLIAKDGYIIYNKAFGYNTYRQDVANHTSNIYDVASITKISATLPAIMKLYDEHKLVLDAPLSTYFTPLLETNKKEITVKEVLCHNAGLKSQILFLTDAVDKKSLPGPLFSAARTKYNTVKVKDRLYINPNYRYRDSTISNNDKPGYDYVAPGIYIYEGYRDSIMNSILNSELNKKKEYLYSDLGFILLKYALEEITQEDFDLFCHNTFYKKLGAYNTGFPCSEQLNQKYIIPSSIDKVYRKTEIKGTVHDPAAAILGGVAGHAGLFSTAEDLAKIMDVYLEEGCYGGEQFFSPATVNTFVQKNDNFSLNRRALGFDKPETDPKKPGPTCHTAPPSSFGHTGFTGTMAWCDPDNKLIYIFLSNRTYPDEFNTKLSEENIRTNIQNVIYQALQHQRKSGY